ncbi:MAG TPA: hypothetical protein VF235_04300 [Actinomycetota bacterium]
MTRTELLRQVSAASSLNQISSVMAALRGWLAEHPDDDEMHEVFRELARAEREHFAVGRA